MRVSSPVFVGRLGELHRLQESLGAARDGTPAVFLVTADAGVGKTRFVDEMALRARASGYRVLSGGCVHLRGGALPFEPFVEAFRDLAPEAVGADASTATQGTPSEFARLLAELPASPQTTAGPRDESQSRLFELALGLLRRLSTEAPLLLIVEDIHWADRSTLDLLAFLGRNLRRERVVLLVTCRTDELHRRHPILSFLAELDRSPRIHRLQLRPLERSELAEQLAAIVGADLDPGQLDRIWLRSEGNPFYAEELLAGGAGPELPETLREVLLARISLLSEPAQQLVRVASVAGRRVEPELLEASGGLDQGAVEAGLREAVDRRILVVGPDADAEYYAFRHALVGEAIYAELLPGERRSLHASLATALATLPDAGANTGLTAEIAHHWHSARDYPRALAAAVVAGKAAERAYATSEALAQYELALELWERVADAETLAGVDRAELLAWAGRAARNVSASRAVGHIRAAIALIDERADPIRAGLLYEQLSHCSWEALDGELALSAAREALRLVPPEPASIARAIVLAGYAKSLLMSGQRREVIAVCREAVAMSREAGAPGVEGQALCSLGFLICDLEDFDEGVAMCRRAREIGVALDDALLVTRASTLLVSALATNRPELALEVALEAFDYSQRHGFAISYGATQLCTAIDVLYDVGRWDEAEAIAERAGQLPVLGLGEWDLDLSVAQLDIGRGRFEDASRRIASLRSASRLTDPEREAGLQSLVGDLAIWQGDPGRARAAAAQPLRGPPRISPASVTSALSTRPGSARRQTLRRSSGHVDDGRMWTMRSVAVAPSPSGCGITLRSQRADLRRKDSRAPSLGSATLSCRGCENRSIQGRGREPPPSGKPATVCSRARMRCTERRRRSWRRARGASRPPYRSARPTRSPSNSVRSRCAARSRRWQSAAGSSSAIRAARRTRLSPLVRRRRRRWPGPTTHSA
jgi:tetratricopeptide (TPR) repeat protein